MRINNKFSGKSFSVICRKSSTQLPFLRINGWAQLLEHIIQLKQYKLLKIKIMGNLLYIIAVILVIGWLIGFVGFHAGGLIHILLVIAIISVLLRLISGNKA
jgi:uncharacterized protein DUF5670